MAEPEGTLLILAGNFILSARQFVRYDYFVLYLRLDMRVGLIKTAKKHPDADSLYVEEGT